ncbi:MAG TPA: asparaginase [Polyangiales bacterium]
MSSFCVEQRRGHVAEAVHRVHACASGPDGRVQWAVGDDLVTTFRSAAKPFQLEVSWERLPPSLRARLRAEDLALGAASHHGEPVHLAGLEQLLAKLGREPRHLYCGAHEPSNPEAARALAAQGQDPSVLHNNCAGKHAFMAAASAAHGEPEDYRPAGHPLQRAVAENLLRRTQYSALSSVVDGCGAPCFVLPLSAMARCYAQLAQATRDSVGSVLSEIGRAYLAHPLLMSGSGAFDGWLNQHGLVAKVGAQGLLCVGLPGEAVGIAIKVESGVDVVRAAAVHALLVHVYPGLLPDLPTRFSDVRNVVGEKVGEIVADPSAV